MVETTVCPVRLASTAEYASLSRISPTTTISGSKRRAATTRFSCAIFSPSSSDGRESVCTTLFTTLPSLFLTSESSLEPDSIVKILLPSGTVSSSAFKSVVLPEEVAPATRNETPYRRHIQRNSIILFVAVPTVTIFSVVISELCKSLIEAAIPLSSSTTGLLTAVILVLPGRCPWAMGDALSIIMPEWCSSRFIISSACRGLKKCSSAFSVMPLR